MLMRRILNMIMGRWQRPKGNGFVELDEDTVEYMQDNNSCPYCGAHLLMGPQGGMSINVFCSNPDCNSRFNIGLGGLLWGQFAGECPPELIETLKVRQDNA